MTNTELKEPIRVRAIKMPKEVKSDFEACAELLLHISRLDIMSRPMAIHSFTAIKNTCERVLEAIKE